MLQRANSDTGRRARRAQLALAFWLVSYMPLARRDSLQSITRRKASQSYVGGLQKLASSLLLTAADGETPALQLWEASQSDTAPALAAIIGAEFLFPADFLRCR